MATSDVKIVVVGDAGCGKSALMQRLLTGRFQRVLPPTYGAEFGAKRIEVGAAPVASKAGNGSSHETSASASSRRVSCSIWVTSGSPRFHKISCRFLQGADAVLVCWDPTSRASWDMLRAWVTDARREEPAARIYLCTTKIDLLVPAHNAPAQLSVPELEVTVERLNDAAPANKPSWLLEQQQQQKKQQQMQHQQQQQQVTGTAVVGKLPLVGASSSRGSGRRLLEAPKTPIKVEGLSPAIGTTAAASSTGRQIVEEHEQAAAANLVASLTGRPVPSPFAAAAGPPARDSPDAGRDSLEAAAAHQGSGAPAPAPAPAPACSGGGVSQKEWEAISACSTHQPPHRASSDQQRGGLPGSAGDSQHGSSGGCRRRIRLQEEEEEAPEEGEAAAVVRQQMAVPEVAIAHYCHSEDLPMFWASSRTGEGVAAAFSTIAQEVFAGHQRWLEHSQAQLQCGRWALLHGRQQQGQREREQQEGQRLSLPERTGSGGSTPSGSPLLTLQQQMPRQPPGPRTLSVDDSGRQQPAERRSSRSAPAQPPGSRIGSRGGHVGDGGLLQLHEYVLDKSQFEDGRQRAPEEQSCCIS